MVTLTLTLLLISYCPRLNKNTLIYLCLLYAQDPLHREKWIQYSAKDAVCTFELHRKLSSFLANMAWEVEAVTTNTAGVGSIEVLKQGKQCLVYLLDVLFYDKDSQSFMF